MGEAQYQRLSGGPGNSMTVTDQQINTQQPSSYVLCGDGCRAVVLQDGVHLHCGREGLFQSELQFSPHA
jgi:hypothetical protein